MYCDEINELTLKNFDGTLSDKEKIILLKHLEICQSCKKNFESFEKLFSRLEEENSELLFHKENYFQSLTGERIVTEKLKRNLFELNWKPAVNISIAIVIGILMFFLYTDKIPRTNERTIVEKSSLSENINEYSLIDFVNAYFNQNHLVDNLKEEDLSNSEFFKDAIILVKEIQQQMNTTEFELNSGGYNLGYLNDQDLEEILSQLENKKF